MVSNYPKRVRVSRVLNNQSHHTRLVSWEYVIARNCQILGLSPRFTSVASRADELSRILASAPAPYDYEILPIDLSSLSSIRAVAASLNKCVASGKIPPIRALILNAIVLEAEQGSLTSDGLQTLFTVNYLANFLLVLLLVLLVLLVLGSIDKEVGWILMISTPAHDSENWMSRLVFAKDDRELFRRIETVAKTERDGGKYMAGMRGYAVSKCLLLMFIHVFHSISLSPHTSYS